MSSVVYVLLGMLDIYALFALMFKSFRLPYFEYIREITIIAFVVSVVSLVVRIYLEAPAVIDIVLHLILYIIFFRYLIKVKVWRAAVISLVYFGYGLISFIVYLFYVNTSILPSDLINESSSYAAEVLQITQISLSALISWLLHRYRLGFSFIIRPPHDLFIKTKLKKNDMIMINSILVVSIVFFGSALYILHYQNFLIIPLNLIGFSMLIYLAYRKDMRRG